MIYIVIIILAFILLAVSVICNSADGGKPKGATTDKRKEAHNRLLELQHFKAEAPSRIRIFKDSLRLIQETNNVNTFVGRCQDLISNLNWLSNQVSKGMPLDTSETPWKMRKECYECINCNALRLALNTFAEWSKVERKKGKRFDNATIKAFNSIDSLLSCITSSENKFKIKDEIEGIRNTIEDIYSEAK